MSANLADLAARVEGLLTAGAGARVLIGIAGAPGSGKTTLAHAMTEHFGAAAAHVPMDGFHLSDSELSRLGRAGRKGAPDTFDVGGYAALLTRLRHPRDVVYAPAFDREVEQPIAGSIAVDPAVRVVFSEGNYLLLADPDWQAVAGHFDEIWYCAVPQEIRLSWLIARHERYGKSSQAARGWALGSDQRNADLVETSRVRADLVLDEVVDGQFDR
jgi:pantothenate kinase